ncbi:MAG: hypothetical protein HQM09_03540 [Candidatus Riflebacteria bacterium]|nr:hypothetical protein [Candidatus Riflebacteria bacterium]
MTRNKRILSWVALFFANLFELFFFILTINNFYFFLSLICHGLASFLLFIGLRQRHREVEKMQFEIRSIAHEHLLPTSVMAEENFPESPENIETQKDDFWTRLAIPVGLCMPFLGVPGLTLLALGRTLHEKETSEAFEEYREYIRYRVQHKRLFHPIEKESALLEKMNIEPVIDLLTGRDKNQIWGSIEVLSKSGDERSVSLIKKTMDNQDMDVKFYSSWGLDKIETRYQKALQLAKDEAILDFDRQKVVEYISLLHQYLNSQLVEGPMIKFQAEEALALLDETLAHHPEDYELLGQKALFMTLADQMKESLHLYRKLFTMQKLSSHLYPNFAEALYLTGDFVEVAQVIDAFSGNPENEIHLVGRPIETSLEDLRAFWVKAPAKMV